MKYNPFLSPELQETMKRISNIHLECVQNILPSIATPSQIQQIQETLAAPYKELIQSYSSIMSSSVAFQLSQLSESLNSAIHDNVRAGLYSTLSESLKNAFPYHELQQQILNLTPALHIPSKTLDYPENLGGLPKDDYVIVDDQAAKTYELPDSVCIPIGNRRIKMPTSILLSIIEAIISAIITISIAIAQSNPSSADTQKKQLQVEEARFQLQYSENEMLRQLLHDIDTSSSSEAETIKELQETVEELHKQYSQTQDTCSPVEEGTDNSKSNEGTDIPK
ncbi:hypothetical protein [Ruminococcus sp. Marseille-P328]|jgi:hypothetical protein|uniref:hypothetical protein n=1 Tax=Ruminococcus sp. Marseille-P328 TaxID=1816688 RepID=UPI00356617BE